MNSEYNPAAIRERMVAMQLIERGIRDENVLRAMRRVPREKFVDLEHAEMAHDDRPIPIGAGQTISQPFMVAYMIEALGLQADDSVLEIGAGSGYAAAVLSEITRYVFAIERIKELAELAKSNLRAAGYARVQVRHGDGTQGWPEAAPFDAVLVSAGAPSVPLTLRDQLKIGGRMVVPIGKSPRDQVLMRITRVGRNEFDEEDLGRVRFVPLIGEEAWQSNRLGLIQDGLVNSFP